jgi:hypothetical protein
MVHLSLALAQAGYQPREQVPAPGLGPVAVQVPVPALVLVRTQVEAAALTQMLQLQRLLLTAGAAPFLEAGQALPPGKAPEVAQSFRLPGTVQARVRVEAQDLGTVRVPVLVLVQGKVPAQAPVRARVLARARVPAAGPGNQHPRCFLGTLQRPQ